MRLRQRGHLSQMPAGISRRSSEPYLGRRNQFSTSHLPGEERMTAKYDYSLPASCRANLGYAPADADRTRARAGERVHRPLAHPDAMESVPIWSFFQSARVDDPDAGGSIPECLRSRLQRRVRAEPGAGCLREVLRPWICSRCHAELAGRADHDTATRLPQDGRAQVGITAPNWATFPCVAGAHSIVIMNRATIRSRKDSLRSA